MARRIGRRRLSRSYSRKFRSSRRPKFTLPLAIVAGFVPAVVGVWNRRGSGSAVADYLQMGFTGITPGSGQFSINNMRVGLIPVVAGFFTHMIASKIGINRAISRAGIPWIRI